MSEPLSEESREAVLYAMQLLRECSPSLAALAAIEQVEREAGR